MSKSGDSTGSQSHSPFRRPAPQPTPAPSSIPQPRHGAPPPAAQQARDRFTRQLLIWGIGLIAVVMILGVIGGTTVFVIALIVAALVALFVIRAAMQEAGKVEMYCPHCGITGVPRTITKGSTVVEVVLWFAGLLPGLIYSIWRLNSRHAACPSCHQAGMIPANSPRALELKRKTTE